ncbi:UVI-1 protein [Mycena sanguinolenta]|uniref:UVI-1 protein n=1 Tax=Mycena sanguinolenta TaxID=230812 RepID=A0A8H6YZE3_9AGAR|nr:UVI-1 protein [Mycena sanguinolenta]
MNLLSIFVLLLLQQFAEALGLHTNALQGRQSGITTVPISIPPGAGSIELVSNTNAAPNFTFTFNADSTVISIAPITDVVSFSFVGTAITTVPIPSGAISMQIMLSNFDAAPDIDIVTDETMNIALVSGLFGDPSIVITTSGEISMTPAQVVAAINLISNISQNTNDVLTPLSTSTDDSMCTAQCICCTTFQVLVNDINTIISNLNSTVTILEASGPLDTTETDHSRRQTAGADIVAALDNFVAVHQAFLSTIIGKHSIFAQFQVTAPIADVLRNLEVIIDSFAFSLIAVIPEEARRAIQPQLGTVSSDQSALDTAVGNTITVYDEICIPSSLYPVILPSCVSNTPASHSNSTQALQSRQSVMTSVPVANGTDLIQIVFDNNAAPNLTLVVNPDSNVLSFTRATEITGLRFIGQGITTVPIPATAKSLQITLKNSAMANDVNIGVEGVINTVEVTGISTGSVASVDILS